MSKILIVSYYFEYNDLYVQWIDECRWTKKIFQYLSLSLNWFVLIIKQAFLYE